MDSDTISVEAEDEKLDGFINNIHEGHVLLREENNYKYINFLCTNKNMGTLK